MATIKNRNKGILKELEVFKWLATDTNFKFVGDPILKKKCKAFKKNEFGGNEMKKMAKDLINTLKNYRTKTGAGRGLAANQIGYDRRMVVVWLGDEPEIHINPEVVKLSGKGSYWESCISGGGILIGEVIRPWKGTFSYHDLEGKKHILEADEKQTRLFLHEMDHLNGKSCQDKYEKGTMKVLTGGAEEIFSYSFKKLK